MPVVATGLHVVMSAGKLLLRRAAVKPNIEY